MHIKNNFLAAEMNSRHAKYNVSWYPSYQKDSMLAENIYYTLSELNIVLELPLYRSISMKTDQAT